VTPPRRGLLTLGLLVFTLVGCNSDDPEPQVQTYDTPAPPGSVFPSLILSDDRLWLAWTEVGDEESTPSVRVAERHGDSWSDTETIATGNLFVNWADFASLATDGDGSIGAHWLVRGGGASFAYGIRFAVRDSTGEWSAPQIPHGRDHPAEHGFVSTVSESPGEFDLVWLDGREMERGGEMELRQATWSGGTFQSETVLDDDVCTCCQTDAAVYGVERFVAYRDHAPGEIRDISFVRFDGATWSAPTPLSNDGWRIGACPVNGPALGSRDRSLTLAWFTQADDEPRVWAKRSDDFGLTFGKARRIDVGDPLGRVDVAVLDDGSAVVVWLERVGDEAVVSLRRWVDDEPGPVLELGRTAAHRESGFPRLASDGSAVWAAWTETSRPAQIRLSRIVW
jgi:hypothetical protein